MSAPAVKAQISAFVDINNRSKSMTGWGGLGTIHSSKTTKVAQEQKVLSETQREPGSLVAAKLINSS